MLLKSNTDYIDIVKIYEYNERNNGEKFVGKKFVGIKSNWTEKLHNIMKKNLGFVWKDGKWFHVINDFTGTSHDFISHVGLELLAMGYAVEVEKPYGIIDRQYEKQKYLWLLADDNELRIYWRYPEDFYNELKDFGSYKKGGFNFSKYKYDFCIDFIELNGGTISDSALKLIETAKNDSIEIMLKDDTLQRLKRKNRNKAGVDEFKD